MLQRVAVGCSEVQWVAVNERKNPLKRRALQYVAICCCMLQYVAVSCSELQSTSEKLLSKDERCSVLYYVAALQRVQ